jgi:hypothetical protein
MLFDGVGVAATAATDAARRDGHRSQRENIDERLYEREREIARLDSLTRLKDKIRRGEMIKSGWRDPGTAERIRGLDDWVKKDNEGRDPLDHVCTLSADEISRKLPKRK